MNQPPKMPFMNPNAMKQMKSEIPQANIPKKSNLRESCKNIFLEALKETQGFNEELYKTLSENLENDIYSLYNNENNKNYRDKINAIKMRLKGTRNNENRLTLLQNKSTTSNFINSNQNELNSNFVTPPITNLPAPIVNKQEKSQIIEKNHIINEPIKEINSYKKENVQEIKPKIDQNNQPAKKTNVDTLVKETFEFKNQVNNSESISIPQKNKKIEESIETKNLNKPPPPNNLTNQKNDDDFETPEQPIEFNSLPIDNNEKNQEEIPINLNYMEKELLEFNKLREEIRNQDYYENYEMNQEGGVENDYENENINKDNLEEEEKINYNDNNEEYGQEEYNNEIYEKNNFDNNNEENLENQIKVEIEENQEQNYYPNNPDSNIEENLLTKEEERKNEDNFNLKEDNKNYNFPINNEQSPLKSDIIPQIEKNEIINKENISKNSDSKLNSNKISPQKDNTDYYNNNNSEDLNFVKVIQLELDLTTEKQKNKFLEEEILNLQQENQNFYNRCHELENHLKNNNSDLLKRQYEHKEAECSNLRHELSATQKELKIMKDHLNKMIEENSKFQEEYTDFKNSCDKEKKQLRQELSIIRQKINEDYTPTIENLKSETHLLEEKNKTIQQRMEILKKENLEKDIRIKQLLNLNNEQEKDNHLFQQLTSEIQKYTLSIQNSLGQMHLSKTHEKQIINLNQKKELPIDELKKNIQNSPIKIQNNEVFSPQKIEIQKEKIKSPIKSEISVIKNESIEKIISIEPMRPPPKKIENINNESQIKNIEENNNFNHPKLANKQHNLANNSIKQNSEKACVFNPVKNIEQEKEKEKETETNAEDFFSNLAQNPIINNKTEPENKKNILPANIFQEKSVKDSPIKSIDEHFEKNNNNNIFEDKKKEQIIPPNNEHVKKFNNPPPKNIVKNDYHHNLPPQNYVKTVPNMESQSQTSIQSLQNSFMEGDYKKGSAIRKGVIPNSLFD